MSKTRHVLILTFLLQLALAACANESNNPRIAFPLLVECKNSIQNYLNEIPDTVGLSFRVIEFDQTIESHPSIIGYVEIETKIDSNDGLVMIFNKIKSNCYPETSTTLTINGDLGDELSDLLNINNRLGIDNTYIVVEGNNLKIYYHDK